MAITDITEKILSDAKTEAEHIISGANTRVKEIEKETRKEKDSIKKDFDESMKRITEEKKGRTESTIKHNEDIITESSKRKAIEEVFTKALSSLNSLSKDDYVKIIKSKLEKLPKDTSYVKCVTPDGRKDETLAVLEDAGLDMEIETTDAFEGGCIVVANDSEFDFRFERLLGDKKKELEMDVAKILFN